MGNKSVGIIIATAVALLLGVVLISIIADTTITSTDKRTSTDTISVAAAKAAARDVNDTTFTVTYPPTNWETTDCPLTGVSITNSSGTTLTETTDWTMTKSSGVFNLVNTSTTAAAFVSNNNTLVTYQYCDTSYVNSSWGRTILNMVPGFFALALLLGGAFIIYFVLREEGVNFAN